MAGVAVFLAIFVPMLVEWRHSMANERALRRRGGVEPRDDVYVWMSLAYPGGFVAMLMEAVWRGRSIGAGWLAIGALVFTAGKALKYWAIATLGPLWSFRVIVVPGTTPITSGPYRWLRHPNYVGLVGEFAGAALMTRAWVTGPLALVVFAALLWRRMIVENAALEQLRAGAILRRG